MGAVGRQLRLYNFEGLAGGRVSAHVALLQRPGPLHAEPAAGGTQQSGAVIIPLQLRQPIPPLTLPSNKSNFYTYHTLCRCC